VAIRVLPPHAKSSASNRGTRVWSRTAFEAEITEIGVDLDDWYGYDAHLLKEESKPFEALVSEMTEGDEDRLTALEVWGRDFLSVYL